MIALTGIVFSLTFVVVQFSATAYSPRLAFWIARDQFMAHAFGVFTATFIYAIAALAGIDRYGSGKVPFISAWIVVALLLGSVAMFIGLIQRVGRLQIGSMLIYIGKKGREAIARLYGPPYKPDLTEPGVDFTGSPLQILTHQGRPRAVQSLDLRGLVLLAEASGGVIEMSATVGDTVLDGMLLLRVFSARHNIEERRLKRRIALGGERSFEQDPKYAIRLLVDIAIRALSPAVNDPTTAVQALDQIEDLLLHLGRSQLFETGVFRSGDGKVRLSVPFPTWEDFVRLGLDEIQIYGASSVQVMRRLRALLDDLVLLLPVKRHAALNAWEYRLKSSIERSFAQSESKFEASIPDRQGLGITQRKVA
jgi:uncharacterized membrane protein